MIFAALALAAATLAGPVNARIAAAAVPSSTKAVRAVGVAVSRIQGSGFVPVHCL